MGWANCGTDDLGRQIGYAHPATCDYPGCTAQIHRGLSYVCVDMHRGDESGCGRYLCGAHRQYHELANDGRGASLCAICYAHIGIDPADLAPDLQPEDLARLRRSTFGPALDFVCAALGRHRFMCTNEAELQETISGVLTEGGIGHEREVELGASGRIDFVVAEHLGVELKVKGSVAEIARQLERYAAHPRIEALLLVTTRHTHVVQYPDFHGRPVRAMRLSGGGL